MKLTIVIPTKNRDKSLRRAINSIEKQTFSNFNILIVDQSKKYNKEYDNNNKISYYHKPKIESLVEAKNYSLKHIKTEYVGFLDDDVELDINFMRYINQSINDLNPLGISGTDNLSREKNIIIYFLKKLFLLGSFSDQRIYFFSNQDLVKTSKLSGGYSFLKMKVFQRIEFRREKLFHLNEDVDISLKIKKEFKEDFYINRKAKLTHHTKNINTINMNDIELIRKKISENISSSLLLYKIHLNKYIDFIPLIWFLFGYFLLVIMISIKYKKLIFIKDYIEGFKNYNYKKTLISF